MRNLLFILFITPILSQELMINSFDSESNFDETYWELDMSGSSGLGYANCSSSNTSHDNNGAVKIEYNVQNEESWGGFTKLSHFHPDANSVYDFSNFNVISFWYYNEAPASQDDRMDLRFVLYDISTSPDNNVYSESQVEYFYSFHYEMLDMSPGWNKVEIPLTGSNIPDQAPPHNCGFNNTGWNGIPGDNYFNLDAIKGFALEFFINSDGPTGDFVEGTIIIDELKVEYTNPPTCGEDVTVTFQVDMSNENVNPACGPSLAGSWSGWQWTETLEEIGNDIWSVDVVLTSGISYDYKFGNCGWSLEELESGSECTITSGIYVNRFIEVPNQDTILDTVCYGGCEQECSTPGLVNITFQVDTNNDTNGFDPMCEMFLMGSFQEPFPWDIELFPINLEDSNDDGIWNTTISLLSGTDIEYKFTNCEGQDAFIENDNNLEICSINGNRTLAIPYQDTVLDATYFNSCNSEGTVITTFKVDMTNEEVGGGDGLCGVHIGGTFNYFDWWTNELSDNDGDDIWETSVVLDEGAIIEYKFANCGSFEIETVPEDCGSGNDLNRTFTVPEFTEPDQYVTVPTVCFESCSEECGDIPYSMVTFSVDMSSVETADRVFASGPGYLLGPTGIELNNLGDDIWSASISIPYGEYTYKYRNGYYTEWDADGWEELAGDCSFGEFSDRRLIVYQPVINLDTACFGSCELCGEALLPGDVNQDDNIDVLDIVLIVNHITGNSLLNDAQLNVADFNGDSSTDVLDIVQIINYILNM